MDWYSVDRRLAPLFRGAPRKVGAGFWIPAKEAIPLAPLLDEALDEDEREEFEGTFVDWPAHVELVLEGTDARTKGVLSAFWSSSPGSSSVIGLELVGVAARSYLCYWADFYDGEGYRAVACLQPGFDDTVARNVVEQVLLTNGTAFGLELFFGSPPDEFSTIASGHRRPARVRARTRPVRRVGRVGRVPRGGGVPVSRQEILRQGDVLLVRIDALPPDVVPRRRRGRIVLAEGEATGHAHVVSSRHAVLHVRPGREERYLVIGGATPAVVRHEEHDPVPVPPGAWEVRRQREYDPGSERWIAD